MYRACCSLLFKVHRNIRSGPKDYLVGRLTLKGKMGNELLAPPLEVRVRLRLTVKRIVDEQVGVDRLWTLFV